MGCAVDAAEGLVTFAEAAAKVAQPGQTPVAGGSSELAQNLFGGRGPGGTGPEIAGSTPVASTNLAPCPRRAWCSCQRLCVFDCAAEIKRNLRRILGPLEALEQRRDSL